MGPITASARAPHLLVVRLGGDLDGEASRRLAPQTRALILNGEGGMKYIWLIEDYSRSNDGEAEYYGYCESKAKADLKAAELNLVSYAVQKSAYLNWLAGGAIVVNGSRPSNPDEGHTDFYEVVPVPLVWS